MTLSGLKNVTVTRGDSKGLAYYPADHAAVNWYGSSDLSKSRNVQTFDWNVTFTGLVGPQALLQVRRISHVAGKMAFENIGLRNHRFQHPPQCREETVQT